MLTTTATLPATAPAEVPAVPAEQLERIATREPRLPAELVPREPQRTGEPSTFRGWTMGGRVD